MDWFDVADLGKSSIDAFSKININKALVLGVGTDILFPSLQQKEIAENLSLSDVKVEYKELNCTQGHDSFLADTGTFAKEISAFIKSI